MRATTTLVAGFLLVAGTGAATAEQGSFFKNLFSGNGGGEAPSITAPRAMDPNDAYCPPVSIADGGAAFPIEAGGTVMRHQITFGRLSRECTARDDGSIGVKVGIELRALLGPSGAPGKFDAPLTIAIKYNGVVLTTRSRRVAVTVAPGTAHGTAAVIESDLPVPADKAVGYDIEVGLGTGGKAPAKVAAKRKKPSATQEATATSEAPVTLEAPAVGQ